MRATIFLLSTFLSLYTLSASAQVARLDIDNPAPRAGDDIRVTFGLEKQDLDKSSAAGDTRLKNSRAGFGDIKVTTTLADTGKMVIGPFTFTIRNKAYTTEVLTIHVYPPLPSHAKEGIWIREVDFNGDHFLIIEQRIAGQRKKAQKQDAEITIGFGSADPQFASLNEDKFEASGLDIITSSSRSGNQILDANEVSFRVVTFKFKKTDAFKGMLKFDRKFLNDVPDNVTLESILIK